MYISCMYIYIYIYTINTYMHIICMDRCMDACTYMHTCMSTCMCMYTNMYPCMSRCIFQKTAYVTHFQVQLPSLQATWFHHVHPFFSG